MLLAQSPVELLSIQLKRLPAVGAEERWYLAVVGGLEKDGKGCWTLCLAEGGEVTSSLHRCGTGKSTNLSIPQCDKHPLRPYV